MFNFFPKSGFSLFFSCCLLLQLISCAPQSAKTDSAAPIPELGSTEKPVGINTLALLQGKWQSNTDTSNFIVFEGDHRKEISAGSSIVDDEIFVLGNACMNAFDKQIDRPKDTDKYISCSKSDLCWYIIAIDAKTLTLSYTGRGNILNYSRVPPNN